MDIYNQKLTQTSKMLLKIFFRKNLDSYMLKKSFSIPNLAQIPYYKKSISFSSKNKLKRESILGYT